MLLYPRTRCPLLGVAVLGALFTAAASAQPRTLVSGRPEPFEIGPVAVSTLFHGDYSMVIRVPEGAARLDIRLRTSTPEVDVDLIVRYGQDADLADGRLLADHIAQGETGDESLEITADSKPPLRPGEYYISLALFSFGVKAAGSVTATVSGWGELSSKVVGAAGGKLEGGGMAFLVPAGAFSADAPLKLSKREAPPEAGRVTSFYRLEGLPAVVKTPLTVELEPAAGLGQGKALVFFKVEGEDERGPMILEGKVANGRIVAALPAMPPDAPPPEPPKDGVDTRAAVVDPDRVASLFWAMGGVSEERSGDGNFIVHFPAGAIADYDLALEVAQWAEEARAKLGGLGIAVAQRQTPVDIYLYSFGGMHGSVYLADPATEGQTETELWGKQGIGLSLNLDAIRTGPDARIKARTTLIHELFHVYQSLYDPRAYWRRNFSHSPWLWMMEAASTWSEKLMAADPGYLSPNTQAYRDFLLRRGLEFAPGGRTEVQRHGYGASLFLEYLAKREGPRVIGEIFNRMRQSAGAVIASHRYSPVAALHNIDVLLYLRWLTFVEDLAAGAVHSGVTVEDLLSPPNAKIQQHAFRDGAEGGTTFRWDAPDLSANAIRLDFRNQNTQWSPGAPLKLTLANPRNRAEVYVYRFLPQQGRKFVGKLQAALDLPDAAALARQGGSLEILVANGRAEAPYTGTTPLALSVEVSPPAGQTIVSKVENGGRGDHTPTIVSEWLVEGQGVTIAPPGARSTVYVSANTIRIKARAASLGAPPSYTACGNGVCMEYKFGGFTGEVELLCTSCGDNYRPKVLAAGAGTGAWLDGGSVTLRGADTSARADREQFYVRVYFTYDLKEWEERSGTVRYEVKGRRDNHMAGISVEYR